MKQIRFGAFETNSSSTHALVLFNDEDYKKFKNGEIILNDCCQPVPLGEIKLLPKDNEYGDGYEDEDKWCPYSALLTKKGDHYYTYSEMTGAVELEEKEIKTPNGDIVHGVSIYIGER